MYEVGNYDLFNTLILQMRKSGLKERNLFAQGQVIPRSLTKPDLGGIQESSLPASTLLPLHFP